MNQNKPKAVFCWSGGKDSAYCLYLASKEYDIVSLLTTVNKEFKRISMHGIREEILIKQVKSIGLPLEIVYVENPYSNKQYEKAMADCLLKFQKQDVNIVIFGDIFLEDLRKWREKQLGKINMKAVFPLWKKDTKKLIREFIDTGFKTITCCVSDQYLTDKEVGTIVDRDFINQLPDEVDPCGENGEFHSFVYDGPIFEHEIYFKIGEIVYRPVEFKGQKCPLCDKEDTTKPKQSGFWFCDLVPNGQ